MSEWKKEKLGDYVEVLSGFAFKSKDFTSEGVPVIKIKNISPPNVSLEDLSYVPMTIVTQNPRYILSRGDVLIAMTGSHINQIASVVGRVGRIRYDVLSVLNQRVGKIVNKDDKKSSLDFVYYYLSQYEVKVELAQKAGGAANQANISPKDIKDLMFPCPPVETQHRIATILSRYESLIENYQKQIKLLEEAAQRLYKEWFVDLHFPGHENTKIVDGVPEGWEKKKVGEIAIISAGGDKPDVVTEEQTTECQVPIYSNGTTKEGLYGYTNKSSNTAGSITVSARGSIGFACLRMHDYFSIVRLISIKPQNNVDLMYLFQFTKVHTFMSNGAAQQQLTVPMVKAIDVVYPAESLLEAFENVVLPLYQKVQSLQSQLRLLTEARDRLLPKLLSGEITV